MAKSSGQHRWDRVAKARARIANGLYDDASVLDTILSPRRLDRIQFDLDHCQIGQGHQYRDLVAESLSKALADVVDVPMSRCEFQSAGGRGDIELPLRTEVLPDFPLWARWSTRYDVRNVIVETKNEKKQAGVEDVSQLAGYLNQLGVGRFGFLVARNGFSRNAMQNMSAVARRGDNLIIPLAHEHLSELGKASRKGPQATMEYLRRRETLLLQG